MNLKRIFGAVLTVLGIIGLIYAAVAFANSSANGRVLITYGVLGFVFFVSGLGLVRTTKDEA